MTDEGNDLSSKGTVHICEASIAELRAALEDRRVTSTELVSHYLNRIAFYDRQGLRLNAVPVLNPLLFDDAREADDRRRCGECRGPLDGIPYLAKASYAARGLPLSSGSPAFEHLIAQEDAYVIAALRAAGAILIGLTNMPPMAAGGMQRGLYGRAESPYNPAFLTAAFASGSSNGSGSALAADFAAFALGEETWSSGRAPASNNGLVAYTPSRGLISMRGNWPLIPTMDVVVPYARSMTDLFEVLKVIVGDDPISRGDFWRTQKAVTIPRASTLRPRDYTALCDVAALRGKRIGVPRMYVNKDTESCNPIATRATIIDLWAQAARDLAALGAEVVEVDFPLVSNYEGTHPGARSMVERGLVPKEFAQAEGRDLIIFAWDDFLAANADPKLNRLAEVDGELIVPRLPGAVPDRYEGIPSFAEYAQAARAGVTPLEEIPHLKAGLQGLEETRRLDFEQWLTELELDFLAFPAVADVAPADADFNPRSADIAWRNGTWVANGNQAIRHFGLPTVTVPMGLMADIGMPVGLTFAGRAYDDETLLRCAYAFEQSAVRCLAPSRTPPLMDDVLRTTPCGAKADAAPRLELSVSLSSIAADGHVTITVHGMATSSVPIEELAVFVNGEALTPQREGTRFEARANLPFETHYVLHSRWRGPYGSLVMTVARDSAGGCAARYVIAGGNVKPD